jgi:hypothetical protein
MTALSKSALKALWKAYFQPTSADFSNLIDSWTDYNVSLQALGQQVSAGGVGVPKFVSTTTVTFVPSGTTGESLLGTNTQSSALSVLGLSSLSGVTVPIPVSFGGTGVASLSANHVVLGNGTSAVQLVAPGTSGNVLTSNGTTWQSTTPASTAQNFVQQVYAEYSAHSSTTTVMPLDDTIPQNTEGAEFMSVSITPTSLSNYLLINVTGMLLGSGGQNIVGAIFRDSIADAIAAGFFYIASAGDGLMFTLSVRIAVPSTSSMTFKFRAGPGSGTLYFNGYTGRLLGAIPKSTITVTEVK